jgi:hypothetical protein
MHIRWLSCVTYNKVEGWNYVRYYKETSKWTLQKFDMERFSLKLNEVEGKAQ